MKSLKISKPKGIAFKTFLFTSAIITAVIVISFGILYAVLPRYYHYSKNSALRHGTSVLVKDLNTASTYEQCADIIANFALKNSAEIMSFDTVQQYDPSLSTPFVLMDQSQRKFSFRTVITGENGEEIRGVMTNTWREVHPVQESSAGVGNTKFYVSDSSYVIHFQEDIKNGILSGINVIGTLQPIDEAKTVVLSLMPYLLALDILIASIASFFYAKLMTKPILHISKATRNMQEMSPDAASNIRTNDEIGELSRNLDSLYEKLCANIENLNVEMEKVQLLEKSKTDFMRAASHELKTPIAGLSGVVEGMLDNIGIYKNRDKYLAECKNLINNLSVLVNEILGASRLDSIDDVISPEDMDIGDLLREALGGYETLIREKELELSTDIPPHIIKTDARLFLRVLTNLISNAVAYTEKKGKIYVSLCTQDCGNIFSIENECQPIPDDELEKLFEPFYTRSYSRNRSQSGTGLGLYIVRRNLELLDIAYKIENTEIGCKFSLYI